MLGGTRKMKQPIELDSYGYACVYVQQDKVYKVLVKNKQGNFTVSSTAKGSGDAVNTVTSAASAASGTSNVSSLQPFVSSIPFTYFPLVMSQKVITSPLVIQINSTSALPGASVIMRLVADGVIANVPTFVGATQVTGSSGWDNTAGMVNLVQFQYDGSTYWFSIVQAAGGSVVDLQQPSRVSATINSTGNLVTILFNDSLLASSLPIASEFTGATITASAISDKTITLTLSPAIATGTTFNLAYSGTRIKDLAGNLAPSFTNSLTVAPAVQIQGG